jgi:hypothetical protein
VPAMLDAPASCLMPKRNPATGTFKMDPSLLAMARRLVPWLSGDLLKKIAPELHARQEAEDGGDVTMADYIDHLLRDAITRDYATVTDWIAKHQSKRP